MAISDPENAAFIVKQLEAATACILAIDETHDSPPDFPASRSMIIESFVVNSTKRARAYNRYNGKLSGGVYPSIAPDISKCNFDPSKMRN